MFWLSFPLCFPLGSGSKSKWVQLLGEGAALFCLWVKPAAASWGCGYCLERPTCYSEKASVTVSMGSFSSDRMDCRGSVQKLFPEQQSYSQGHWGKPGLPPCSAARPRQPLLEAISVHLIITGSSLGLTSRVRRGPCSNHNSAYRYVRLCVFLCNLPLPVPHTMQHSRCCLGSACVSCT